MKLNSDIDVKIAGDKPSRDVKRNLSANALGNNITKAESERAKKFGKAVAEKFISDTQITAFKEQNNNLEMMLQRRMLLSFTATIGFELYSGNDVICGIAQKSFLDTVKKEDNTLYCTEDDTGAFSFYYLAYRRGGEVDRRIGQTFAMLCSHDGDPIYQELGEALYCWFLSEVKNQAEELGIKEE